MMCRITRTILAGVGCFSLSYAFICRTTRIIDYDLPHSLPLPPLPHFNRIQKIWNYRDSQLRSNFIFLETIKFRNNDLTLRILFLYTVSTIPISNLSRDYRSNIYYETLDFFSRREDRDSFSDRPVFYRLQRGSRSLARHQRSNLLYVFSCVSFFFFCMCAYANTATRRTHTQLTLKQQVDPRADTCIRRQIQS